MKNLRSLYGFPLWFGAGLLTVFSVVGLGGPAHAQSVLEIVNENVGIGTSSPQTKVHVLLSGTPFDPHPQTAMLFQNDGSANDGVIFSLIGSDNGQINFGTQSNEFAGRIVYSFGQDAMRFFVNGSERARITSNGNLGIGTSSPAGALDVNGAIYQRGGVVHPDYVFEEGYQLESIEEHATYMWEHKHLPAVGPGRYDEQGRSIIDIGANSAAMLEELEKAHIYIAQLSEELEQKDITLEALTERLESLEQALSAHDASGEETQ